MVYRAKNSGICDIFPYPDVDVTTTASSDVVDERTGLRVTVAHMFADAKKSARMEPTLLTTAKRAMYC